MAYALFYGCLHSPSWGNFQCRVGGSRGVGKVPGWCGQREALSMPARWLVHAFKAMGAGLRPLSAWGSLVDQAGPFPLFP